MINAKAGASMKLKWVLIKVFMPFKFSWFGLLNDFIRISAIFIIFLFFEHLNIDFKALTAPS